MPYLHNAIMTILMKQQYLNEFHKRNSLACLKDQESMKQRPLSIDDVIAHSQRLGKFTIKRISQTQAEE